MPVFSIKFAVECQEQCFDQLVRLRWQLYRYRRMDHEAENLDANSSKAPLRRKCFSDRCFTLPNTITALMQACTACVQCQTDRVLQDSHFNPVSWTRLIQPGSNALLLFQSFYYRLLYDALTIRNTVKRRFDAFPITGNSPFSCMYVSHGNAFVCSKSSSKVVALNSPTNTLIRSAVRSHRLQRTIAKDPLGILLCHCLLVHLHSPAASPHVQQLIPIPSQQWQSGSLAFSSCKTSLLCIKKPSLAETS